MKTINGDIQTSDALLVGRETAQSSILFGVMLVLLGMFAVMAPGFSGITVTLMIGAFLLFAGGIETYYAFQAPSFKKGALKFLFGGIGILAGIAAFAMPVESLQTLTLILAILFTTGGLAEIVFALQWKKEEGEGWGWLVLSGVLSVGLAVFFFSQWPMSGIWALGVVVGIRLMFHGFLLIRLGSAGKELMRYYKDVRVDVLEDSLRAVGQSLQETQALVLGQSVVLLALDAQLRQKVSAADVDPAIQDVNEQLKAARIRMKEAAAATDEAWGAAQNEAQAAFAALQKNVATLTDRVTGELGLS